MTCTSAKHKYWVVFDYADYICCGVCVYADTKAQVRRIMKDQYGKDVKIRYIDVEE